MSLAEGNIFLNALSSTVIEVPFLFILEMTINSLSIVLKEGLGRRF